MKTRKYFNWMLMTLAVLGLSMGVASCVDNIDNNGGTTPGQHEEVVQSKTDKYWSVVSQLVSTDDYTPDYENKTFEPVYGVAQEGDPTTRLVYTNDVATAAERFADIFVLTCPHRWPTTYRLTCVDTTILIVADNTA